jgi:hypothetical protein
MTVTVDRKVEEFTATPRQLFINGQWAQPLESWAVTALTAV